MRVLAERPGIILLSAMSSIQVLVWDERQPRQQEAYDNFIGNEIAAHLISREGLEVRSVGLDDPDQGLSDASLDACQVLIWWGHVRHREVPPETGKRMIDRVIAGRLALIVLHSAHWATPFIEAMDYRTRSDAREHYPATSGERIEFDFVPPANRFQAPAMDAVVTPCYHPRKFPGGITRVRVQLPICCFPSWRADGKPSFSATLLPDHPIANGIPKEFSIPQSEMYDEPLHVPDPDEVIFEDRWPTGEWFRSGMVWQIGRGRLFYFRPGHETYPIYRQPIPWRSLENAVRWLGAGASSPEPGQGMDDGSGMR